jgi:hypothetical protein
MQGRGPLKLLNSFHLGKEMQVHLNPPKLPD